jgi:hypothetical protein
MKSKDLQKLVLSKYNNGDKSKQIFIDLHGAMSLRTIERWSKMIRESGSIGLNSPPGCPQTVRTKESIQMIKRSTKAIGRVSARRLAIKLNMSRTSVRRVLKNDLRLRAYKTVIEPLLTDEHKLKRKKFSNWARTNYRKEDTGRILFSDEKMFDIDGICNSQNERIWAVDRAEADAKGCLQPKRKFPQKVMVWLGVCSKRVSPLVIFEKVTLDHTRYIEEVLLVALKYGNKVLGSEWTFQQDGAKPHTHAKTQQWCSGNFSSFIDKERWPPNSPDLNPLDYCVWKELAQTIKWDCVTSKKTLIDELEPSVKKIRAYAVFESCMSWSNRLFRISQNVGDYLR